MRTYKIEYVDFFDLIRGCEEVLNEYLAESISLYVEQPHHSIDKWFVKLQTVKWWVKCLKDMSDSPELLKETNIVIERINKLSKNIKYVIFFN